MGGYSAARAAFDEAAQQLGALVAANEETDFPASLTWSPRPDSPESSRALRPVRADRHDATLAAAARIPSAAPRRSSCARRHCALRRSKDLQGPSVRDDRRHIRPRSRCLSGLPGRHSLPRSPPRAPLAQPRRGRAVHADRSALYSAAVSGKSVVTPTAPARANAGSSDIGIYSPRRHNTPRSS
jgi:hypothetical protein